jgi:hypothetical protein
MGLSEFQDFVDYSDGLVVSRPSKRPVRSLYLTVAGHRRKYFLKQAWGESIRGVLKALRRHEALHSSAIRELFILELFRDQGIPVMNAVAWGEHKVFGWPVKGFILVEAVVGGKFVEVYRDVSLRSRRRMMWVYGELMGVLHHRGIKSKVLLRDLILISQDYSTFRKCLVLIDREHGLSYSVNISLKQRGRALGEIWAKGALIFIRGERSELLAFLAGYFAACNMRESQRDMRVILVQSTLLRATEILTSDARFSNFRQSFKERYGIHLE